MSKLGKRTDQRMAMLKNQVSELLWYGQIETTVDRAKAVRSLAEKYITIAMRAYQDDVKVTKTVADAKGAKKEVVFTNDGQPVADLWLNSSIFKRSRVKRNPNPLSERASKIQNTPLSKRCSKSMLPSMTHARTSSDKAAVTPVSLKPALVAATQQKLVFLNSSD